MTDEQKPVESPEEEQPTPIDPENPPEPIKEMQARTIREIRAETVPPQELPDVARELREGETPEEVKERREIEAALDKPIEEIENAAAALDRETRPLTPHDVLAHDPGNVTNVFGFFTVPAPIYDVVFVSLFAFTVIEVLVGSAFHGADGFLRALVIVILLAIAFVKAFHVVWYYMHLGSDDRLFWGTLAIPFFIAIIGLIYLAAVPVTGY